MRLGNNLIILKGHPILIQDTPLYHIFGTCFNDNFVNLGLYEHEFLVPSVDVVDIIRSTIISFFW